MTSTLNVLRRYLTEVVVLEAAGQREYFEVPTGREAKSIDSVAALLADPRIIYETPDDLTDVDWLVRPLVIAALWLGSQSPERLGNLSSRAARFRFLVWSVFTRLDAAGLPVHDLRDIDWPAPHGTRFSPRFAQAQSRAARADWLRHLSAWEDDGWLSMRQARGDGGVERDLLWITTTWPRPDRHEQPWPAPPAVLDFDHDSHGDDDDHRRTAADLADRLWLPAGSLLGAAKAFLPHRRYIRLAVFAHPVLAAVVVALFAFGVDQARWFALALTGAGLLTVALLPPRLDALALLRIPAAAAVGEVVLLSLTPRWWVSSDGWKVGALLIAGAALYLMIENRLHGVSRSRAALRAAGLTAVGSLHAAMISLVVLGFVAPRVAENGQCLDGWWSADPLAARPLASLSDCANDVAPMAAAPVGVIVLMTGWSLAFGLAAQILWDDRPVTAPLGRQRRRTGGT